MSTVLSMFQRKRSPAGAWLRRPERSRTERSPERAAQAIPRTLHQVFGLWDDPGPLPARFSAWAARWRSLHPDWSYVLWSRADVEQLLKDEPSNVRVAFENFPRGAQRADLARYLILHRHGGVYADLDVECFRSLEPVLQAHTRASAVLFAEGSAGWSVAWRPRSHSPGKKELPFYATRVGNFAMAATPRAPALAAIIDLVIARAHSGAASDADVLHMTGPGAVTDAVHAYRRTARDVFILSARRTGNYLCHRCTNTWVRDQDILPTGAVQ